MARSISLPDNAGYFLTVPYPKWKYVGLVAHGEINPVVPEGQVSVFFYLDLEDAKHLVNQLNEAIKVTEDGY